MSGQRTSPGPGATGRLSRALRRRWSAVLVGVVTVAVVATAVVAPGFPSADLRLHDGSVFVTNSSKLMVGKFNKEIDELSGSTVMQNDSFDVLQDEERVLTRDLTSGQTALLDSGSLELTSQTVIAPDAQVSLGSETVTVVRPDGTMWTRSVDEILTVDFAKAKPDLTLGPEGRATVTTGGQALGLSVARHQLVRPGQESADPVEVPLPMDDPAGVELSAVGDRALVLDRAAGQVWLEGSKPVAVPQAEGAVLQAPADAGLDTAAGGVDAVLATTEGLRGISGSQLVEIGEGAAGTPAVPVIVNGCVFGAFASGAAAQVVDACGGAARVRDLPSYGEEGNLVFRVNRDVVVLNDTVSGNIWLPTENLNLISGWDTVTPPEPKKGEDSEDDELTEKVNPNRDPKKNRAPDARDDTLQVRAGRTTAIDVLGNDSDPDGDILTVSEGVEVDGAELSLVRGGTGLQVSVPPDASGVLNFPYTVDDGRGGKDTAQAAVTVLGDQASVNTPPHLKEHPEALQIGLGEEGSKRALLDWTDDEGDDLILVDAQVEGDDEVTFTPDGTVTFTDVGTSAGRKEVELTVSDGLDQATDTMVVNVRKSGAGKPIANGDFISATVGQTITVDPLANDVGEGLMLSRIDDVDGAAKAVPDFVDGTFEFTATEAKTYYVGYNVNTGGPQAFGLVRIDVREPEEENQPPVAVSDSAQLAAGGKTLVDPLANDEDPDGDVLVLQSVSSDPDLKVTMKQRHLLEIQAVNTPEAPVTLTYTVSDGEASVDGTIVVSPAPPTDATKPTASPDEVVIRAGDSASIRPMTNDTSPIGLDLTLDEKLPEEPKSGAAWVDGEYLRIQAPRTAGELRAVYQVRDANGQTASAQVRITVIADEVENNPPEPEEVTGRVLAGTRTKVMIPVQGIDAEGDSVRVLGPATGPKLGRISQIAENWLEYEAYPDAAGTDTFQYEVIDARGARAVGEIEVGVVPRATGNTPPTAVDDSVTGRPGSRVRVPALANDSDPDGDAFGFAESGLDFGEGSDARVVDGAVEFTLPDEEGSTIGQYVVIDERGAEATGQVKITTDKQAPLLPPVAVDDVVSAADVAGKEVVEVDARENDYDPDGVITDAEVTVPDYGVPEEESATVRDGTVQIPVGPQLQHIRYQITDTDGKSAWAMITVPGRADSVPALKAGVQPQEVRAGEVLELDVNDFVIGTQERQVELTAENRVWATNGEGTVEDSETVSFIAPKTYAGPASVVFEVIDDGGDDARKAVITIPITVLPALQENREPTFEPTTLTVGAGEDPKRIDLTKAAKDADSDDLTFGELTGEVPDGVSVDQDGSVVTAEADVSVPPDTRFTLRGEVSDGEATVATEVTVVVRASARPNPRANDDTVADARQGEQAAVDVLANDSNPFPDKDLRVVDAVRESGTGSVSHDNGRVMVTPGDDMVGRMVVRYQIEDATQDPDRRSEARVTLIVKGRPEAPGTPRKGEVGDQRAVLTWTAPKDNGEPISHYTVQGTGNDGSSVSEKCPTTTCTITGLTNDVRYTFTVTATNAVGESDPSGTSAEVRPDVRPGPVATPKTEFGDHEITLTWAKPENRGSALTEYEIQLVGDKGGTRTVKAGSTSHTWSNLTNGAAYRFRVRAHNSADEPGDWSAYSAPEVPAGKPTVVRSPRAQENGGNLGHQASVSWQAPADENGDAVSQYKITGAGKSTTVAAKSAKETTFTGLKNGSDYAFTVRAKNKAGWSDPVKTNSVRIFGAPKPPSTVKLTPGDRTLKINFSGASANGKPIDKYEKRVNGSQSRTSDGQSFGATNGTKYTAVVRACSQSKCSGWSASSNGATPYGKPSAPALSGERVSEKKVRFEWSGKSPSNGRNAHVETRVNGKSWVKRSLKESVEYGDDYDQTFTLEARMVNTAGQASSIVKKTVSTADPPKPTITAGKGAGQSVPGCEDSSKCFAITGKFTDFGADEELTCDIWSQDGKESPIRTKTITMNGSGSGSSDNLGIWGHNPNKDMFVRCQGPKSGQVDSNKQTW